MSDTENREWEAEFDRLKVLTPDKGGFDLGYYGSSNFCIKKWIRENFIPRSTLAVEVERMRKVPTKHDRCTLDDNYCYDHKEVMIEEELPNGAYYFNSALDAIKSKFEL